ncbi:MAG: Bro-N domain-containing protein [Deltaproteobacteria bacterium]|nr:Bro-N domain-containing protein [Deltaproteobacteria bacterium]
MTNLTLIKSENFGTVKCDFYSDDKEIWMTREQIGTALEYSNPGDSIRKIHERNKERLDKFSVTVKLSGTDGKLYNTYLYNAKGVYEICRWSRQPKADQFYDWVYEILEGLRKGEVKLMMAEKYKKLELEARLKNARSRQANILLKIAKDNDIPKEYKQVLYSHASKLIAGKPLLPLPETEKTYSAEDIAKELGITANMVGRIANRHNLKSPGYGLYVWDKSPNSPKQVQTWRYNEAGRKALLDVFRKKII